VINLIICLIYRVAIGWHGEHSGIAATVFYGKPAGEAGGRNLRREKETMSHFAALHSIVFMIGFVSMFDLRHRRRRLQRLLASITLMTPEELDRIRRIQSACAEA